MNTNEERKKARIKVLKWYLIIGFSELCSTAILVFVSCLGTLPNFKEVPNHLEVSVGAGVIIFIIFQTLGHISGCYANPMITLSAMISRILPVPAGLLYVGAQFVGALVGYGVLLTIVPRTAIFARNSTLDGHHFCVTVPHPELNAAQAFFLECIADFLLVILCSSLWEKRNQTPHNDTPIKVGFAVFGLVLTFGDFTGPSLNTARSFAPAVFTGTWTSHWIYWLAPISAAIVGSLFYRTVFHNFEGLEQPH